MLHQHVLYNEQILSRDEAFLRPGQVALFTGWGVFTTMRSYQGVLFAWDYHWERLSRDARLLHVAMPDDKDALYERLTTLVERNERPDSKLRLNIMRSQGGLFEGPGSGRVTDIVAFTTDLSSAKDTVTLDLRVAGRHAASPFAGAKCLSWAHNLTMFESAHQAGYDDALLLNERGEVSECTSANVFAVLNGVTHTPPIESGLLPGITRKVMMEELSEPVQETVLLPDDIYRAEEVFITSSTRELVPVVSVGDRRLPVTSWPVMARLRSQLRDYIGAYLQGALRRQVA